MDQRVSFAFLPRVQMLNILRRNEKILKSTLSRNRPTLGVMVISPHRAFPLENAFLIAVHWRVRWLGMSTVGGGGCYGGTDF